MVRKKERPGIMLYHDDWSLPRGLLNNEELGFVIRAFLDLSETGEAPSEYPNEKVMGIFKFLAAKLAKDAERYEEICKARSEAGKIGRRQMVANDTNSYPTPNPTPILNPISNPIQTSAVTQTSPPISELINDAAQKIGNPNKKVTYSDQRRNGGHSFFEELSYEGDDDKLPF